MKADIEQGSMDLEPIIPTTIYKAKPLIKADICMKFYDDTKLLY